MTDPSRTQRWDVLPTQPQASAPDAAPGGAAAPRRAPAAADGAAPAAGPAAAEGTPPRRRARRRDAAAAGAPPRAGGDAPPAAAARRSAFDHDAPTAKLPAVPKQAPRKRAPITKPGPFPVIAGSAGLFFAIAAFLAFQMRAGADPALGAGKPVVVAQATTPAPRKVLVRRVIVTRIVEHRPRRDDGAAAPAAPRSTSSAPAPRPLPPRRLPRRPLPLLLPPPL